MTTVRPGFRKWLRIVLPPLVLVFGWVLWGDIEYRRFQAAVADVERRVPSAPALPQQEDGARFYAAAAVLADVPTVAPVIQTAGAMRDALVANQPFDAVVQQAVRETLAANEVTVAIVDRASMTSLGPLRYQRFDVIKSVPVWSVVMPIMSVRTLDHLARGEDEQAVTSLISAVRFLRGASADPQSFAASQQANAVRGLVADVAVLLHRGTISDAALEHIDHALATVFQPGDLQRLILGQSKFRYSNVSVYGMSGVYGDIVRPARYRVATGIARNAAEALDIADLPWPERVRGMARLSSWSVWLAPQPLRMISGDVNRRILEAVAENYAEGVGAVAVGRTAIAIERDRRSRGRLPETLSDTGVTTDTSLDPFSGLRLLYRPEKDSYLLYSVGRDGHDDGGDIGPPNKAAIPGSLGRDLGIGVRRRSA